MTLPLVLLALTLSPPPDDPPPLRNLLILCGDDHAAYTLGVDGDPHGATPNLDRLAAQGTYFRRCFTVSPVCTPSRQAFLTGRYPHAVGVTLLQTPLPDDALTLGEWLEPRGFATAALGKMHFNTIEKPHGFSLLFDIPRWQAWLKRNPPPAGVARRPWHPFHDPAPVWLNAENQPSGLPDSHEQATLLVSRAAEFLRKHRDQPFALIVSFHEPHSPFVYPNDAPRRFDPADFPARPISEADRLQQPRIFADITPDQARGIQAAYYTSLAYMDSKVGQVLATLDDLGLTESTLVVYWGDNGYLLGHHGRFEKHVMFEPAVRVPLIIRAPGHAPAGRVSSALVETIDVLPTVLTLLGQPHPPALQGRDLGPVLSGPTGTTARPDVFSEYLENEEAMIRDEQFKLVVGTGRRARLDGYETGRPLPGPYLRLYDLEADPGEDHDLAGDPPRRDLVADLRSRLLARFRDSWPPNAPAPPVRDGSDRELFHYLTPRDAPASRR